MDTDDNSDRPHQRTALIATELRRYNIDIVALSETRFLDEGSLIEEIEGYTFWKGSLQVDNIRTVWDWQLRTAF